MQHPAFFADAAPLDDPTELDVAAESATSVWTTLTDCPVIGQEKTNWCWISVGQAIDHYYRKSSITQCQIAQAYQDYLGAPSCGPLCVNCTDSGELQDLLDSRKLFQEPIELVIALALLQNEIKEPRRRPVCCHIRRPGGHFLVIYGFADDPPRVAIRDPAIEGDQWQVFDDFVEEYKNGGVWDQTYYTADHAEN